MIICKLVKTCQRDCMMKRPQEEKDWQSCKFVDKKYAYPVKVKDRKGK